MSLATIINSKYVYHNNQDFHLIQRELLIGLYEFSLWKTWEKRLDAREQETNQNIYKHTSSRTSVHSVKDL